MHTSVLIPYRPLPDHGTLAWTLEGYARQRLAPGHTMDVHVGLDGPAVALPAVDSSSHPIYYHSCPCMGAAAVRNALVRKVSAESTLLILGNADARPDDDMVQQHAATMATLPPRSLILGAAPWERLAPTVLDTLIDTTPMIFSYCHLRPHSWYSFQVAYSLNLSVRRQDYVECAGFPDLVRPYYYEDLAFGWRVLGPTRRGLYYQPAARVLHRHPMTLEQYLDREELLGRMAPVVARVCPEVFAVLMGGRVAEQIVRDFQEKLRGDTSIYQPLFRRLAYQLVQPAATLGPARQRALDLLYQLHIPVKLLAFRLGFLHGVEQVGDEHWRERRPTSLWRTYVHGGRLDD
jgi:hypothetical protein